MTALSVLRRTWSFCFVVLVFGSGCAGTIRQTAKEAAPAAVEGGVKEAHDPTTRDRIAEVLADPEIRQAVSELSQAVGDGVMNAVTEEERIARLAAVTDAFVAQIGASLGRSLQKDVAPAIAATIAEAVQRSLDENTEARMQAIARAVVRGSMEGLGDAVSDGSGKPSPVVRAALGELAREMSAQAALGFQDAVQKTTERREAGGGRDGDVLAVAGRASDAALGVTPFVLWALAGGGVLLLGALIWALFALRRGLRENGELRRRLGDPGDRRAPPPATGAPPYVGPPAPAR